MSFSSSISSNSPLIKSCFLLFLSCVVDTFLKINFLVGGKIINRPIKSEANPGKIKSSAAKAKAAPEIISGAALAFAALLLILRGFATDFFGLLIIFPPTRKFIFRNVPTKKTSNNKNQDFINGEFEDIEDENDKKF